MKSYFKNLYAKSKSRRVKLWLLLKNTGTRWWVMDPFRQSAIIAYYTIFSLPALLVIILAIAGFAFDGDAANGKIMEQVKATMGADTADQVKEMLVQARKTEMSIWASILGVLTMLFGSVAVFVALQKTLNMIWGVEATPRKGIWGLLRSRVFSFGLILVIAFLLIISLVISTVLASLGELFKVDESEFLIVVIKGINLVISLGVIAFLFALMFKFLPDAKIAWRQVWPGALLTSILFSLGKIGLAFYFGTAEPGSGYGAAGSIILILLWTSYSSMILFLGAEFTHTYAELYDGPVVAKDTGKKALVIKV